jgi:ubiquinone biosynthesis protein UbiJ
VASYARDEAPLLARSAQMRQFGDDVNATAARVDGLAQRVDALAARAAAGKPQPLRS